MNFLKWVGTGIGVVIFILWILLKLQVAQLLF